MHAEEAVPGVAVVGRNGHGDGAPPPHAPFADLLSLVSTAGGRRDRIPVTAPFTGEIITHLPACTPDDVSRAAERARAAQRAWAQRPYAFRKAVMLRFHDRVLAWREKLLDLVQLESGKARRDAFEEVADVAANARYYAFRTGRWLRPRRRKGALPGLTHTWEVFHPVGVVGIIAPWNYPLTLAVSDAVPAILAGNSVILKPAEQTSLTALLAVQLMHEAGLPRDVFQVITGSGETLGPALIETVDFVGFTGSTAVGRRVARQAGERLIGCSTELGGKNAILVLDDADVERAAEGAVRGCFTNAGQLCVSFERLYVQRGIYDTFVSRFVEKTRALRLGNGFDYTVDVGSLTSQAQLDKVTVHVHDAVKKGAGVLAGGHARPDLGPFFFEPTILTDVTAEMTLFEEETFGPVVSIYPFGDVNEGVAQANDSPYGLNASVWTRDVRRGRDVARRLASGVVNVNDAYAAAWGSVDAAIGGVKGSGTGRRHGRAGLYKYVHQQTVAVQHGIPFAPNDYVPPRAFASLVTELLRWLRHVPGLR